MFSVICGSFLSMGLFAFLLVYSHPSQNLLLDSLGMSACLGLCFLSPDGERWEMEGRGNFVCARTRVWFSEPEFICLHVYPSLCLDLCCICVVLRSLPGLYLFVPYRSILSSNALSRSHAYDFLWLRLLCSIQGSYVCLHVSAFRHLCVLIFVCSLWCRFHPQNPSNLL